MARGRTKAMLVQRGKVALTASTQTLKEDRGRKNEGCDRFVPAT